MKALRWLPSLVLIVALSACATTTAKAPESAGDALAAADAAFRQALEAVSGQSMDAGRASWLRPLISTAYGALQGAHVAVASQADEAVVRGYIDVAATATRSFMSILRAWKLAPVAE
jgi:hypothetical protein